MARFYCPESLAPGLALALPPGPARHVQVLRLQPGDPVALFNGEPVAGQFGDYRARISKMGRQEVAVEVGEFTPADRAVRRNVHLAVGMPANERMDWLVEKATELGVRSIQPLVTERSVLRLEGERAEKKNRHWRSVAIAACEQCGANQLPEIYPVCQLADWVERSLPPTGLRLILSLQPDAQALRQQLEGEPENQPVLFLSGPEGGLSSAEESAAQHHGFRAVSLGKRVLRAETAAIAALCALVLD